MTVEEFVQKTEHEAQALRNIIVSTGASAKQVHRAFTGEIREYDYLPETGDYGEQWSYCIDPDCSQHWHSQGIGLGILAEQGQIFITVYPFDEEGERGDDDAVYIDADDPALEEKLAEYRVPDRETQLSYYAYVAATGHDPLGQLPVQTNRERNFFAKFVDPDRAWVAEHGVEWAGWYEGKVFYDALERWHHPDSAPDALGRFLGAYRAPFASAYRDGLRGEYTHYIPNWKSLDEMVRDLNTQQGIAEWKLHNAQRAILQCTVKVPLADKTIRQYRKGAARRAYRDLSDEIVAAGGKKPVNFYSRYQRQVELREAAK